MLIDAEKITWTEAATIMSMDDVLDLQDACVLLHKRSEAPTAEIKPEEYDDPNEFDLESDEVTP